ncbi:MAG: polysaccharide biosynthesis protein [Clostridia bacterium]|nr:polysaccharide biosynthesis protein [Clostridia bacterium]
MNKYLKSAIFLAFDTIVVAVSYLLSMRLLRYDVWACFNADVLYLVCGVALALIVNLLLRLYVVLWSYAGFWTALRVGFATVVMLFYNLAVAALSRGLTVEWAIITTFISYILIFASRFAPRLRNSFRNYIEHNDSSSGKIRLVIIGAGGAGAMLIREMKTSQKANLVPVCVLDDDPNKKDRYVNGVKVVGTTDDVEYFAKAYSVQQIIIAMPSVDRQTTSKIIARCQKTNCKIKMLPGIYQLAQGNVSVSDVKDVSIEDLLGREQVRVNLDEIIGYIEQKTVLVTGGGGSIGSELCRQIATHNPKHLIIVDIYENNAYDIEQELLRNIPGINLTVLIASVRDENKINKIFEEYKPEIVFHAAAHKHVPLMETSPNEAVKNNVVGTFNVASAAGKFGVKRFILISTDKAVNPTNVMGATKRICEMIIQTMNKRFDTEYVAVRFGNVLGSNGSVIPLFKKQIKNGGPVTVTHKDIVRYFMTIPEAVSLVLQAGAYAKGGEIFVLDMGEPVRIYDLAENMIKLSGFEPHVDIEIKVTGLRPGEKLYEERLMAEEGLLKTENKMISIGKPLEIDEKNLFESLTLLKEKAYEETDDMKKLVSKLVPTYKIDVRK